jgi:polysaccharide biosynthesis protein PslH
MKLFVITSRIPYPLEKGDKLRIFHQMKELSKNHQIYLCALHSSIKKEDELAYEVLNKFCKEVHFIKLAPIQIVLSLFKSLFTGMPFQTALFTDVKAKQKVSDLINSISPNHIYCQLTRAAEYVRSENRTKTLDYMDAFSKGMERRAKNTNLFTRWVYSWEASKQKKYEKDIFSSFDSHCIITEEDQNCIDLSRKKEIKIIRNGVDFNYFIPQKAPIKYDIVFVGNMGYAPNIDAAQFLCNDILPLIKMKIPTVKILLAGAEPSLTVQNLKSETVEVSGWLKDIRTAYSESNIFIAPMRIGTGLQNKLLEAMAMNKACVTTPLANKALKAPTNSISIGFTTQELADECILLLNNKEQNNRQALLGNNFVKDAYQWSKTTDELTKLFLL